MPQDERFQKHTLNLYEGDYERLKDFYPDIGAAVVIRRLVRSYLDQIEQHGNASIDAKVEIKI